MKTRIVIVGAGFAGVAAARALHGATADVVLVDRRNHHVFQPLLYQVATAVLSSSEIAVPIRELEVGQPNLTVLMAEVTAVSIADRTVEVALPGSGFRKIPFDYLVVATGSHPSYFGHDEFGRYAPGLKTLSDAEAVRGRILRAFEVAETTDEEQERARQMTFVLVGAGPTGVELAASLAHMVKVTLRNNFRGIDPARATIMLLDGAPRILPTFSESVSGKVAKRLEKLGVKIVTSVKVEKVDDDGVIAAGTRIRSATVLWTAGVAASPVSGWVSASVDRAGRAMVGPHLDVVNAPGVFVVGDAASIAQGPHPVPGVAQAAIQEGRYVGRTIARQLLGKSPAAPFHYIDLGNMAVVGKNFAALERGRLRSSGFLTFILWMIVHILALPQMRNRLRVQREWFWSYLTGRRSARIIPESRSPPVTLLPKNPAIDQPGSSAAR